MRSIPESTVSFFQEYNISSLDPTRDRELVIERLLAYGNRDEVHWLVQNYGMKSIQSWLAEFGVCRLPRRRYRLWCVLFDVVGAERKSAIVWPY